MGKKIIFFILFLILIPINFFPEEKQPDKSIKKLIKRTIIILPFINISNIEKYQYLSGTLRDTLKAKLLKTDLFKLINFSDIDENIIKRKYTNDEISMETTFKELAVKLKADVVVSCKYLIVKERIMIQISAFDIFTNQTVAATTMDGEIGLDIFTIIDDSANDISDKMSKNLKMVDKTYFEEMNKILKKEERLKLEKIYTPRIKAGISLTAIGGSLIIIGLPILIYDLAGYTKIVNENLYYNQRTDKGYNEYVASTYINTALFSVGLTSFCLGTVIAAVGIPFILYDFKKKNKKIGFNIIIKDRLTIVLSYKF